MTGENGYSEEQVEFILMQLDSRMLPFEEYCFQLQEDGQHLAPALGRGGFAEVRSAGKRKARKKEQTRQVKTREAGEVTEGRTAKETQKIQGKNKYAIKVIGFGKHEVGSEEFFENATTQQYMYEKQQNIVRIFDVAEVHLWLDENLTVTATKVFQNIYDIQKEKTAGNGNLNYLDDRNRTCLVLRFIVMEQLVPIVTQEGKGRLVYNDVPIASGDDEAEFLKVAYDIGLALRYMYKEIGMLHRDIKPQNIFYDPAQKKYKLGDFGIATVTEEGLTDNADAYTFGYVAPEVLDRRAQKYDNTADIYSLGMTIYLLLNDLTFPAERREMYREDYVLPVPENAIWPLFEIVKKMCRHNPEERYQNIEEALNDIEELATDSGLGYKRKHAGGEMVLGMMLLLAGTVLLELAFYPALETKMNIPMYLFAGLTAYIGVKQFTDESWSLGLSTLAVLLLGIYLLITTGFTVWKLILLFVVLSTSGTFDMVFGGVLIAADLTCVGIRTFLQSESSLPEMFSDYSFAALLMVTFAVVLLWEASVLASRQREGTWRFFKTGLVWLAVFLFYLDAVLIATGNTGSTAFTLFLLGRERMEILTSLPLLEMGIAGMALSVFWIVRERVMRWVEEERKLTY